MMKIAFLSHLDLNLYLFRLPIMKELVKNGYKVYAVCPKGSVFDRFGEFGIEAVGYKIDRSSLNIFQELKTIRGIKSVIETIQPDILHTFMHKPNIYGNLTAHPCRINTITGLGSFFIHSDIQSKAVRFLIELLYKTTMTKTKKVIFQNSDDYRLFLKNKIVSKEQAVLIKSSGIDTKYFSPMQKDAALLQELQITTEKPIVLMIARVIKDKGVLEYIEAAKKLEKKAVFLYVGDIDKGNKNALDPDWKNVRYLGFRKDIRELISICDIFVLPSYREGVPRTLLEAASMQKAIVTTNAVGCREVVEDGKNGFLVPVGDVNLLAKKIERLLDDNDLKESFAQCSRKKAVEEFDVQQVVKQYMEVYDNVCR